MAAAQGWYWCPMCFQAWLFGPGGEATRLNRRCGDRDHEPPFHEVCIFGCWTALRRVFAVPLPEHLQGPVHAAFHLGGSYASQVLVKRELQATAQDMLDANESIARLR